MQISSATRKNTKPYPKPNEDGLLLDRDSGIFLIADGVSRELENGIYPEPSPTLPVVDLLLQTLRRCLAQARDCESFDRLLWEAVRQANEAIGQFNRQRSLRYKAGAIGIFTLLRGDRLHYGYIGDCSGRVLGQSRIQTFTQIQTAQITAHYSEVSARQRYLQVCNHPEHPYGYGVLNGDPRALEFLRTGSVRLEPGDQVLLSTDGLEDFLAARSLQTLRSSSCQQLLQEAALQNDRDQDDRTLIKLEI